MKNVKGRSIGRGSSRLKTVDNIELGKPRLSKEDLKAVDKFALKKVRQVKMMLNAPQNKELLSDLLEC